MDGFWLFVGVVSIAGMVFSYLEKRDKNQQLSQGERKELESIRTQLYQIEKRLQNVESIVVERDKHRDFENLTGS